MNIVFGFGEYDVNLSRQIANSLINILEIENEKEIREGIKKKIEELGSFKDKGWKYLSIKDIQFFSKYQGHFGCLIEGTVSHYRDDHPMSPDGFAMFENDFCLVYTNGDAWGKRSYLAI